MTVPVHTGKKQRRCRQFRFDWVRKIKPFLGVEVGSLAGAKLKQRRFGNSVHDTEPITANSGRGKREWLHSGQIGQGKRMSIPLVSLLIAGGFSP